VDKRIYKIMACLQIAHILFEETRNTQWEGVFIVGLEKSRQG
jgi:hypothetical protein